MPLPKCVRVLEDDTQSREALEGDGWRYVETLVEMKREAEPYSTHSTQSGPISCLTEAQLQLVIDIARENMGPNRFIEDGVLDLKAAQDVREDWVRTWDGEIIITETTLTHPGNILGFLLRDENRLSLVVVDEQERRQGVGKELTKCFLNRVWEEEMAEAFLGTQETNLAARSLYRGLGFRTYRRRVTYHKD